MTGLFKVATKQATNNTERQTMKEFAQSQFPGMNVTKAYVVPRQQPQSRT